MTNVTPIDDNCLDTHDINELNSNGRNAQGQANVTSGKAFSNGQAASMNGRSASNASINPAAGTEAKSVGGNFRVIERSSLDADRIGNSGSLTNSRATLLNQRANRCVADPQRKSSRALTIRLDPSDEKLYR